MDDDNTNTKKRKGNTKYNISYSKMSILDAGKRLGFWIDELKAMPVAEMLASEKDNFDGEVGDAILRVKQKVYDNIVECLDIEGYPTEANQSFKEANVSDLVYSIISPIIFEFRSRTGRKGVRLEREKAIISTDKETGGEEEFVVVDRIAVGEERFVLIIEGKKGTTGEALKQCLLSLKDAGDQNSGCAVYGFITTGEFWQMIRYDGTFQMTEKFMVLFNTMGKQKDRWMKENSVVVDCLYVALQNGGVVKQDVMVVA